MSAARRGVCGFMVLLAACGGEPTVAADCATTNSCPPPPPPALPDGVRGVVISPRELELRSGTQAPLSSFVVLYVDRPAGAPAAQVTSSVSAPGIINAAGSSEPVPLVDDFGTFNLVGLAPGRVVFRVTVRTPSAPGFVSAERSDSVIVRVVPSVPARVVVADSVRVAPNGARAVQADVLDDRRALLPDSLLRWSSSDTTVATVSPETGGAVTVRARREGTALLRATAGSVSATTVVTVSSAPPPLPAAITRLSVSAQVNQLLSGSTVQATFFPVSAGTLTRLTIDSIRAIDPEVATVTLIGERTLRVTAGQAGATRLRLVATAEGPGLRTTTVATEVPVTVWAPRPVLGGPLGDVQFALIPTGSFTMGADNGALDQRPTRVVRLTRPFSLQRTEVTRGQWRAIMDTVPPLPSGALPPCDDRCPVDAVSFAEVQEFLRRLNARDPGKGYRLPTEAEWEYSARAGATGAWPTGSGGFLGAAWAEPALFGLWPVALKQPNAFGLHDMLGNVEEWVADWYTTRGHAFAATTDPTGPDSTGRRVTRGGNVTGDSSRVTYAFRSFADPLARGRYLGFRIARNP